MFYPFPSRHAILYPERPCAAYGRFFTASYSHPVRPMACEQLNLADPYLLGASTSWRTYRFRHLFTQGALHGFPA